MGCCVFGLLNTFSDLLAARVSVIFDMYLCGCAVFVILVVVTHSSCQHTQAPMAAYDTQPSRNDAFLVDCE